MNILNEILENTRLEVAELKRKYPIEKLKDMSGYQRKCFSLANALLNKSPGIIAEIKKASPSKGIIRNNFNPVSTAIEYEENGASAISILTDKKFFQGNIRFISEIRSHVNIPLLRKDFIVDSYQLSEAKANGADAVLLISAALEPTKLHELYCEATQLGLDCLVEIHNEADLDALDLDQVKIIGINNRNLNDFSVDIMTSARLSSLIPENIILVSESGISNRADIDRLMSKGIKNFLIGENFMIAESPGKALKSLINPLGDKL